MAVLDGKEVGYAQPSPIIISTVIMSAICLLGPQGQADDEMCHVETPIMNPQVYKQASYEPGKNYNKLRAN